MSAPLSFSAEWMRQIRRRRTQWIFGILLALPLILVVAFSLNSSDSGDGPANDPGAQMAELATSGAANFTVFTLLVSSGFLLYIVCAMFLGDPVPAEASWSSLRYLLVAPVPRARLLTTKLLVGLVTSLLAALVLVGWTAAVGAAFYGTADYKSLTGAVMSGGDFWPRFALSVGYVMLNILPIGAVAFWIGCRSDAPLAAVGMAIVVLVVASILDAISALGDWRHGLPGHYLMSWLDLLRGGSDWTEMRRGALWSTLYAVIFIALGYRHFLRKNVLS